MARTFMVRQGRLMTHIRTGWLLLGALGLATSSVARQAESAAGHVPSSEAASVPQKGSDATVEVFLTALKHRDFAGAAGHFDANLASALPKEKLASVWDAQIATLGSLNSWAIVQRASANGKDVRLVLLRFEQGELQAILSVSPQTQQLAGLSFAPVPKSAGASYVNPSGFRTEEVSVGSAPFLLKGTLSVPTGKGPFPAVVLVHGSGPNDRDESIGANKPFRDIAEGLASRGIVVLRYDKRTFQYARQLSNSISIDDEVVLDAVAAVNLLRARPEVDAARVFVLGHSLGALLAPEIAVRSEGTAGVILLAAPGRAPWDSILAQMRYLKVPADKLAEVEKAVKRLKAGTLGDDTLLGVPASYWQDWASRDGVAMVKKLGKPTLILRGERDYQVTEEDLTTWQKGLRGLPNVEIILLPGVNHLFMKESGKPGPAEYGVLGHVDEAVIERLASFISRPKPQ
jgi:dienelactone hydrolase